MIKICYFIFLLANIQIISSSYPVVVFHGIADGCGGWMGDLASFLGEQLSVYSICIESSEGDSTLYHSVEAQSKIACDQINKDPQLSGDFSVVGVSQGALIGRYVIEKCKMKGRVKRYASIGGPQMGVGKVCDDNSLKCKMLNKLVSLVIYFRAVQGIVGPAGYYKDPNNYDYYLKYSGFLADLNNERKEKNQIYKERFSSLEQAVFIKFLRDEVVFPKDSEWFEFYDSDWKIVPLKESDFYKKDFIGLKSLMDRNLITFYTIDNKHVKFNYTQIKQMVIPILK